MSVEAPMDAGGLSAVCRLAKLSACVATLVAQPAHTKTVLCAAAAGAGAEASASRARLSSGIPFRGDVDSAEALPGFWKEPEWTSSMSFLNDPSGSSFKNCDARGRVSGAWNQCGDMNADSAGAIYLPYVADLLGAEWLHEESVGAAAHA